MLATLLAVIASISLVIFTCGACGKKKRAATITDKEHEEHPAQDSPQKKDSLDEDKSDHAPVEGDRARHIYFQDLGNDPAPPEEDEFAFLRHSQPRSAAQQEEPIEIPVYASMPAVRPPPEP